MARLIVLDASVLIAHLDGSDAHHEAAVSLLSSTGSQWLGASVITLAEVMVAPARVGRLDEAHEAIQRLGVREVTPAAGSAQRLAQLRASSGLKMPECCVLDAAEQVGARVATFDRSLARVAQEMGLGER